MFDTLLLVLVIVWVIKTQYLKKKNFFTFQEEFSKEKQDLVYRNLNSFSKSLFVVHASKFTTGPIVEESLRYVMYQILKNYSYGCFLSGILFLLLHFCAFGKKSERVPQYCAVLFFNYYVYGKSFWGSVITHIFTNLTIIYGGWYVYLARTTFFVSNLVNRLRRLF